MADVKKAQVRQDNGHQVVVLPEGMHLDGDEVYVSQDEEGGTVTISSRTSRSNVWSDFIAFRDSLDIPQEDLDTYMSERPMNRPAEFRNVFEDEE
jgi:virulence-associated protein VagC